MRTIAKLSGSFVTDDSRVWFTGKLGKPSTITKGTFEIEARQDFGDINVEIPTSKFTTDDPNGRLPGDPLFEGFRIIAVLGTFNYTQRTPSTSFFGRLLGKTTKTATPAQFSSFDETPLSDPVPEVFGSCQMQGIPIAWRDDGYFLHGLWVWCKGPIDNIADIKTFGVNPNWNPAGPNSDGQYGPFQVMSHTGEEGGTGTIPTLQIYVPQVGGNAAEDQAFPGSGFFSYTAFTGLTLMQGGNNFQDVIDTPPTVVALIRGRKVDTPDGTGAYVTTGWTDNPVHIARFILSSDRFVGINSGLLDDASNYLTSLICDAPILNDSDDQHILVSDGDLSVAGDVFQRYRSTSLLLPESFNYVWTRALTVDHTKVPNTNQTNFPVTISGTYSYLKSVANGGLVRSASGYDLFFSSDASGNTLLDFKRLRYDPTIGYLEISVRVPSLLTASDYVIYMHYGDPSLTADLSSTAAFDSNFKAVYPLGDGVSVSVLDATSNANNGTNVGATAVAGQVDGAAAFNGSSQYISIPLVALTTDITLEAWVYRTKNAAIQDVVAYGSNGADGFGMRISVGNTHQFVKYGLVAIDSGIASAASTWEHVAWTVQADKKPRLYLNGVLVFTSTDTTSIVSATNNATIGAGRNSGGTAANFFGGRIDEVRLSNVVRSADWIETSYNNQFSPAAFYSVGSASAKQVRSALAETDGPYLNFDPSNAPIEPGSCPDGFHRDPVSGACVADDGTTSSVTALQPLLQKRYTANFAIAESVKAIDFFYKTLAPSAKLFLRVNKQGRIGIFTELPSDNTRISSAVAIGDTSIQVYDVLPWKSGPNLLAGRILLGTGLITSEVRDVSSALYSTAGNAVTLVAGSSGTSSATASGATLSGGSTTVRASGTITVGGTPAQGNIISATINGVRVSYILTSADTNQTATAMLTAYINAITRLTQYIEAVWDSTNPLVITIRAKHGTLTVSSAFLKAHATGITSPSTAPTVANTAGGSLDAGIYKVCYTDVTALGETCPTPIASVTLTASHKIGISGQSAFGTGVTSRNWYISQAADSKTVRFVVNRVNNSDFTIDILPDDGAALRPTKNTTAEELIRVAMSLATNSQDVLPGWKSSVVTSVIPVVLNDIYLPNVLNGHKYKATSITTGITGASAPVWPTTAGGTVVDSGVTWTEFGETVLGQTGITRANVLKDSYQWPMGSEQSTINQIKGEFVDRKNDFAKTPLLVNDRDHQAQVGKTFPYELDLQSVDSFNQAYRLENSALAKYRDGDWFNSMGIGPGVLAFGLEEGDVICSSDDSGGLVNVLTRIESISIDKEHKVHVNRARLYSTNMFSDDAEKHTMPIPTNLRYAGLADSIVEFIDNFAIRDADALVPGYYVAVSRDLTIPGDWRGWILYADYGDGYIEVSRGDSAAIVGTCTSTLQTPADPSVFDRTSFVTFTLKFGPDSSSIGAAFVSCTEQELVSNSRRNLFLIGTEYVQAATIVDNGNQSFTISTLLRGRFCTDTPLRLAHISDESVVFLNGAEMFVPIDPVRINTVYQYKAVTINQDIGSAMAVPFVWTGGTVKTPAPVNEFPSRNVDGDLVDTWVRRTRVSPGLISGTNVPLGQEIERYQVEIYDGVTVLRAVYVTVGEDEPAVLQSDKSSDPYDGIFENSLFGTSTLARFSAGINAISVQTIEDTDNHVAATLVGGAGLFGDVRFGLIDSGASWLQTTADYQYSFYHNGNSGDAEIIEHGVSVFTFTLSDPRLFIVISGQQVKYYMGSMGQGIQPIYVSTAAPIFPMRVHAFVGQNNSDQVRDIIMTTRPRPYLIYRADAQTLDFGSPQSAIKRRIYQLSAVVGRGEYLEVNN